MLTAEEMLEAKSSQLVSEWVHGRCWDDNGRQCIPDLSDSNWKTSACKTDQQGPRLQCRAII